MVRIMEKTSGMGLLPQLYGILYENMRDITPFAGSFEQELEEWLRCVAPALEKAPRQIALLYCEGVLAGFCMYYINQEKLMIEELQIRKEYRQTMLTVELFRFLKRILPRNTAFVEAFADKRNQYSQKLIRKMGMEPVGETPDGSCIHYRGSADCIFRQ